MLLFFDCWLNSRPLSFRRNLLRIVSSLLAKTRWVRVRSAWNAGTEILLAANPDYYSGRPHLENI